MEETDENFNENIMELQHYKQKNQNPMLSGIKKHDFLIRNSISNRKRMAAFENHTSGQKNQVKISHKIPCDRP